MTKIIKRRECISHLPPGTVIKCIKSYGYMYQQNEIYTLVPHRDGFEYGSSIDGGWNGRDAEWQVLTYLTISDEEIL